MYRKKKPIAAPIQEELPHIGIYSYFRTFSLSQMSKVKFALALPRRENEGCSPTFIFSANKDREKAQHFRISSIIFNFFLQRIVLKIHRIVHDFYMVTSDFAPLCQHFPEKSSYCIWKQQTGWLNATTHQDCPSHALYPKHQSKRKPNKSRMKPGISTQVS